MSLPVLTAATWSEVSALLDEVLALPPEARDGFVEALGGERAAHKDTLVALLAQAAGVETEDFLATLPAIGLPAVAAGAAQPASGGEVGPYRLIEELGSGGMGAVWLAERADGSLKRKVALKLPRIGWDPSFAQRSLRERDILAALEHPHIARLYDAGVDALGRPYLAMEYVRGQPIDAWCDARRLSLAARVDLLRQVADAVAYAHRRLVVHRDLKPSNILVTDDGQVRLLDFGIARLLDADGAPAAEHTLAAPAFTVNYASPEQLQGRPLSTATDIYSLGVVAHELLGGTRPFDHLPERGVARVQAILAADLAPPSHRRPDAAAAAARACTPAALQRALRGDLDAILLRALAREPEQRYPSAEALADDLARWRDGRPVLAQRPRAGYLLRKFVRRHRLAVGASAAAALALVVTTGVAVVQSQQAREQAQRAQASRDFLINLFERADPDLRGGRHATVRELLEPAEREAERLLPEQRREVLATLANLWERIGDKQRAAQVQAQLSAGLAAQPRADPGALAQSRMSEARLALLMGQTGAAERLLREVEQEVPRSKWPKHVQAYAETQAGHAALLRDEWAQAETRLKSAAALAQSAGDAAVEAHALSVLQRAQVALRRPEDALATQRTLAALLEESRLLQSRQRQEVLWHMATTLYAIGRFAEGWPLAQRLAAELDQRYAAAPRPELQQRRIWLRYSVKLGQVDAAVAWLRAHELSSSQLAAYEPVYPTFELIEWHRTSARVWAAAGDVARAERELDRARQQVARLSPAQQAEWGPAIAVTAAHVALWLGRSAQALALLEPLDRQTSLDPDLRPYVAWAGGVALARLQRPREAVAWLRRAEDGFAVFGDPAPPDAAFVHLNLALLALIDEPAEPAEVQRWVRSAARVLPATMGPEHPTARLAKSLEAALSAADTTSPGRFAASLRHVAGAQSRQFTF
jgi:serine/threonine-protein kinase